MTPKKPRLVNVKGIEISIMQVNGEDYISLTDMAKSVEGESTIKNWLRNRNTIEFLGIWENLNNPEFNLVEFDQIKKGAGLNRFTLSAKEWTERTNAKGIKAKTGRYGGTYAHKDIAFEFGSWLSPEFKLYLIKEFQRLKELETEGVLWDSRRLLTRINYHIQTDSIKDVLEPLSRLPKNQKWLLYADEADLLNMIVFGKTAKQWRDENPKLAKKCVNPRDHATIEQLVILANLESANAMFIRDGLEKQLRFEKLWKMAKDQMKSVLRGRMSSQGLGETEIEGLLE